MQMLQALYSTACPLQSSQHGDSIPQDLASVAGIWACLGCPTWQVVLSNAEQGSARPAVHRQHSVGQHALQGELLIMRVCRDTELFPGTEDQGKTKMKELFGVPKLKKDGTLGKVSLLSFHSHMHMRCEATSCAMKGPLA